MARIPDAEIARQLEQIVEVLQAHPEGLSQADLSATYAAEEGHGLPWRTLSRRLSRLVADGRIEEGGTRNRRHYRVSAVQMPKAPEVADRIIFGGGTPSVEATVDDVPLSREGRELRVLVRRPIHARQPIGYQEAMLRAYKPGASWYLTSTQRSHLARLGRTPGSDRPAGTFAREIFERLLIDLAWASSRLEGNTYSRLDTRNLLEKGLRAEGKDAAETQMILNHKKAIELLVNEAEQVGFNRYTLLNLHAALAENLLDDPSDEGRVRTRIVSITGTTFVPLSIPQKLNELLDLLLQTCAAIPDPFEQSFFVMVHLPYLQPFADVNKRTSRLAANISLIRGNLCPLSFVGVPEQAYVDGTLAVYEENRVELLRDVFMWAYDRSCAQYRVVRESIGQPDRVRLQYRPQLGDLVRQFVSDARAPSQSAIVDWIRTESSPPIDEADQDRFVELAMQLLADLHEGAIARYGLRPSQFHAWTTMVRSIAE